MRPRTAQRIESIESHARRGRAHGARLVAVWLCGLAAAASLALGVGCTTAPETGRRQFVLLSAEQERSLGAQAYTQQLASAKIIKSGAEYERIQRIGKRIAQASRRRYPQAVQGFAWKFTLVDDPAVNAWMLPGGNSAVFTGLVRFSKSDDEIAIVMGHEAAHAIARHGAERISRGVAAQVVIGAAAASGEVDPRLVGATATAYGALGETAFSRGEESEADHIGLLIAAEAGYDPRASVDFWKRMGSTGGSKPPELLSTHPSDETRASRLSQLMPEAMRIYRARREQLEGAAPKAGARTGAP